MYDIGFAELVLIAVVGLLVIGPERLPGAIRTGSQWLSHFKRSFSNMKREIEHELEIDSVKNSLNQANAQFKSQSEELKKTLEGSAETGKTSQDNSTAGEREEPQPAQPPPRDNTPQ